MKSGKENLILALILSITLHLGLYTATLIDWNLKEQINGLVQVAEEFIEKMKNTPGVFPKAQAVLDQAKEELQSTMEAIAEGKKLRIGPKHESWKELDLKLEAERKQAEAEAQRQAEDLKEKQEMMGMGPVGFNRFLSPPVELELVEVPKKEENLPEDDVTEDDMVVVKKSQPKKKCSEGPGIVKYGGIGLQFGPVATEENRQRLLNKQPLIYQVTTVPSGYPADLAGIKVGDEIEGDPLRFRGEERTVVKVEVIRDGQKYSHQLTRVEVCYEEDKAANNLQLPPGSANPLLPQIKPTGRFLENK